MTSGRELFKEFLDQASLSRPFFLPFIQGLLSRVENTPMETITGDPQLWASGLSKTTQLFGFDGVATGLNKHLTAQACGCEISWSEDRHRAAALQGELNGAPQQSPTMQIGVEVAKRLFDVCRQNLGCAVLLPGPYTLADHIFGSNPDKEYLARLKPVMVEITEAFCKTGPDLLIFAEGNPLPSANINVSHRRMFNTLKNITSYYDIPTGLFIEGYRAVDIESAILCSGSYGNHQDMVRWETDARACNIVYEKAGDTKSCTIAIFSV
ncbi:MAG: hypothetical protein GY729_18155 [Desulfobacteraceae bacterium]|nr:hypothetical protein [Desulfobacteraceae bacterium]